MKPVTTALKEVLDEVGILRNDRSTYSDARFPEKGVKAVGVKFPHLKLDTETVEEVIEKMEQRGYVFHYFTPLNENLTGWLGFNVGPRFTFSIPK